MKLFISTLLILFSFTSLAETSLDGRYFVKLWSYQGKPNLTVRAHTFATFYKGEDLAQKKIQPATISWLPKTQIVRRHTVETGHNFSLEQTLRLSKANKRNLKTWGPYEIKASLYNAAIQRIQQLESGKLKYSMLGFANHAPNCITAVGDIAGPIQTGTSWGYSATRKVIRHFSPWIVNYPDVAKGTGI